MRKEKVMSILKKIISEAGLEDIISVSDSINKMADFMAYKEYNGLEMFAIDGDPLFPFYSIDNILYDDRKESMHFVSEELHFRILFELWNDYLFIYEMGDSYNTYMIRKNDGKWLTEDREGFKNIDDELKSYTDYFEKIVLNDPQPNETEDYKFANFPIDMNSSIDEEVSIHDIIELYLDPTSEITGSALNELLESMDYSRTTVDMILDVVDSYDIWELYNILFTKYRDLLSDKEYANLVKKYNGIFDIPMLGITD